MPDIRVPARTRAGSADNPRPVKREQIATISVPSQTPERIRDDPRPVKPERIRDNPRPVKTRADLPIRVRQNQSDPRRSARPVETRADPRRDPRPVKTRADSRDDPRLVTEGIPVRTPAVRRRDLVLEQIRRRSRHVLQISCPMERRQTSFTCVCGSAVESPSSGTVSRRCRSYISRDAPLKRAGSTCSHTRDGKVAPLGRLSCGSSH